MHQCLSLQVPCAQHVTLPVCTSSKLSHTYMLWLMGLIHISSLVLSSWRTEQPSPEYFSVLLFRFILGIFCKYAQVWLRSPEGSLNRSRCMILPWSKFDQHLPILRLIYGVLGRKSVAYLDCLYCQAEEWIARGRYLFKFQSSGISNVQWRGRRWMHTFENVLGHFI